jgi:hypothetical protein
MQSKTLKGQLWLKHENSAEESFEEEIGMSESTTVGPKVAVAVEASMTLNMGNYNSGKCGVSVSIPCEIHELEDIYSFARDWVDGKMEELVTRLQSSK